MEILRIKKKSINHRDIAKTFADQSHCKTVIENDTVVYVDGSDVPALVYLRSGVTFPDGLVTNLRMQKYTAPLRQSGIAPANVSFGYAQRNPVYMKESCKAHAATRDNPALYKCLSDLGVSVNDLYKLHNPIKYDEHDAMTNAVLPDWRINDTVFTSGVVNKNSQLPYHFDRGNFKGAWSAMVTVRSGVTGGFLACPELDCLVKNCNGSLLLFDGQNVLHGVTPIKYQNDAAYRFTIVYYSQARMWQCLTPTEELKNANRTRNGREIKRAIDPPVK